MMMQRDTFQNTEVAVRSLLESILPDEENVESYIPLAMVLLNNSHQSHIIIPWRQRKTTSSSNHNSVVSTSTNSTIQESLECDAAWISKLDRYLHTKQQQHGRIIYVGEREEIVIKERIEKIQKLYQQLQSSFPSSVHYYYNYTEKRIMADRIMNVLTWFIDHNDIMTSTTNIIQRKIQQLTHFQIKNNNNNNNNAYSSMKLSTSLPSSKHVSSLVVTQSPAFFVSSNTRNNKSYYKYEEVLLLRECILALEHIDGENIYFYYPDGRGNDDSSTTNNSTEDYVVSSSSWTIKNVMNQYAGLRIRSNILPLHPLLQQQQQTSSMGTTTSENLGKQNDWLMGSGSIDALHICGEAGWLYHKIQNFIISTSQMSLLQDAHFVSNCHVANHGGGGGGAVARALASALQNEIETYQKFVSTLEQQLLPNPLETNLTSRRLFIQLRQPMTTLRSLALIADGISTTMMGGGEILTALYFHSLHGDTRHHKLMNKIITIASIPWYDMLYDWIFHGILPSFRKRRMVGNNNAWDRHNSKPDEQWYHSHNQMYVQDFFIEEDLTVDDVQMWQGRYKLKREQVPNIPCMTSRGNLHLGTGSGYDASSLLGNAGVGPIIVDMDLANEALIVGKGINFIRKCLLDSAWSMNIDDLLMGKIDSKGKVIQASTLDREELKSFFGFRYNHEEMKITSSVHSSTVETITLRSTFSLAASQVHKYILESLLHEHHLIEHLRGLKDFLLLGQGDFISALIDSLYTALESLDSPKEGLYYHHIQGIVQEAMRSTNAAFLPMYVLEKIGVKVLGVNADRTKFWLSDKKYPSSSLDEDESEDLLESFILDYNVNSPLAAVVYPTALRKYHRIFSLLFRLKRIEWMLNRSWKQSRALFHALQAMYIKYASEIDGFSEHTDLETVTRSKILMRKVSMARQSMLHFLSNLQSYLMFEVLEVGWKELLQDISHSKTLDDIIKAHDQYLNSILKKSLLGDDSNYPSKMERQLRIVLTISYRFCKLHDWIFGEANQALEALAKRRRKRESRINAGAWGYEENDVDDENSNMFTLADEAKLEKVSCIASDFEFAIKDLLEILNDKINDGPPRADTSYSFSPSADSSTLVSSSSLSDTGSKRSRRGHGPVIESDALQFLAYRLDFSDYYERRE